MIKKKTDIENAISHAVGLSIAQQIGWLTKEEIAPRLECPACNKMGIKEDFISIILTCGVCLSKFAIDDDGKLHPIKQYCVRSD